MSPSRSCGALSLPARRAVARSSPKSPQQATHIRAFVVNEQSNVEPLLQTPPRAQHSRFVRQEDKREWDAGVLVGAFELLPMLLELTIHDVMLADTDLGVFNSAWSSRSPLQLRRPLTFPADLAHLTLVDVKIISSPP